MKFRKFALAVIAMALPLHAGELVVTSSADAGPGTLRQAILDANAGVCASPCAIRFAAAAPGMTIAPLSPLPLLTASHVTMSPTGRAQFFFDGVKIELVGGAAGAAEGLRISVVDDVFVGGFAFRNFAQSGLVINASNRVRVSDTAATNNGVHGFAMAGSREIDLQSCAAGGNGGDGVFIADTTGVRVFGQIGEIQLVAAPNAGNGVHLHAVHGAAVAGVLRNNGGAGILMTGDSGENDFEGSIFGNNGGPAIDAGTAPPAPVIDSAVYNHGFVRVKAHASAAPGTVVRLAVYVVGDPDPSGSGEGTEVRFSLEPVASATADANGRASFTQTFNDQEHPLRGRLVSALATHVDPHAPVGSVSGSTTAFARNVKVTDGDIDFAVTTTADDGGGSLRDAIERANAEPECAVIFPCTMSFLLPDPNATTIQPRSPLPAITAAGLTIDGSIQGGAGVELDGALCGACTGLEIRGADGLVLRYLTIARFAGDGIHATGNTPHLGTIQSCDVVHNDGDGIRLDQASFEIGSIVDALFIPVPRQLSCLISGNGGDGVRAAANALYLGGNFIGSDRSGLVAVPNGGHGVELTGGSLIGGNTIAFNTGDGVLVHGTAFTSGILNNSIHTNGAMGIELAGNSAHVAPPVIKSAAFDGSGTTVEIETTLPQRVTPNEYIIELFAGSFADGTGRGEGRVRLLQLFVTGPTSPLTIRLAQDLSGKFVAATATPFDGFAFVPNGSTSEFSNTVQVTNGPCAGNASPSLVEPAAGAELGRTTTFRWNGVPGTLVYLVWVQRPGGAPQKVAETTSAEASVTLEPGAIEWWVEARFVACYGTQSEHRFAAVK